MFTVIWLIILTVGLTVQILVANSFDVVAQTLLIALILLKFLHTPAVLLL